MQLFKKYTTENTANRWDRWRKIFDLLEDRHVVPISEIITETGARPALIDKDITTLCERGLVKRTAKGGLTLESYHAEKTIEERTEEDPVDKSKIGRLAAQKYVHEGMSLFMDGSTTVQAMVPFIADRKLRILTNALSVITDLRVRHFPGEIICTGGHYRAKANTIVGGNSCELIANYKADLTIIGVEGVSANMELMEAHPAEALIKQAMVVHGRRTIVLAMPQKLNDDSLLTFATLKQVEALISTRFPSGEFTRNARKLGVRLECPGATAGMSGAA